MIAAVISEYNPFHNGHAYQIEKIKEKLSPDGIIAVMSGSFVQRGAPAAINKFERTQIALSCGISAVIELPTVFSSSSADLFAKGACDILNKTNITDVLCFGCETEDTKSLSKAADILCSEPISFKNAFKSISAKGVSYPQARFEALQSMFGTDISFMKEPNAILALEYTKALKELSSPIRTLAIKRMGSGYKDEDLSGEFVSASALRSAFEKNPAHCAKYMPPCSFSAFSNRKKLPDINDYTSVFYYITNVKKLQAISEILDVTEGLENRICEKADGRDISSLIDTVKTKRYTRSKIARAILHIILGITKEEAYSHNNPYIRILGFRKDKSHILSRLVKNASVPVITNIPSAKKILSKEEYQKLERECTFTNIYYMTQGNKKNTDFTQPLIVV